MTPLEKKFKAAVGQIREKLREAEELANEHGIPVYMMYGEKTFFGPDYYAKEWDDLDDDFCAELTQDPDWAESLGWDAS